MSASPQRARRVLGVCAAVALVLPTLAHAGAFEVVEQGAETAGVAHAGTALTNSESAWFNPAALTDNGGFRLSIGATLAQSKITASGLPSSPLAPWTDHSDTPLGTPPYVYLSYSRSIVAASVSANVPFGGGIHWPETWTGRYDAIESKPQYFRVGAALAVKLGPVAIGGGFHADLGSLRIQKATDHVSEDGHVTILLRSKGFGGDAYLLAHAGSHATIGASYKSRTQLPMEGEADFDVPVPFEGAFPDQAVTSHWTLPDRMALGFAWTEADWFVTTELGLTLWSVNQTLALDFAEKVTDDVVQQNHWRDALALRAGAGGHVGDLVTLRGGLYVDGLAGAPPPPDTLSPSSPDSTRLGLTAGLGVQAHRLVKLDAYVEPIVLLPRSATSADALEASYRGWAIAGGLGVTIGVPNAKARANHRVRGGEAELPPETAPAPAPTPVPTEPAPDPGPWTTPHR